MLPLNNLVVFVPVPIPFLEAGFRDMSHVPGTCPRHVPICPLGHANLSYEIWGQMGWGHIGWGQMGTNVYLVLYAW